MRVGVVSDTHLVGDGRALPPQLIQGLKGVDMVLHCGDLDCLEVLDYLEETVAPTVAVWSYDDPFDWKARVGDTTRTVQVEGLTVGMVHDIHWPGPPVTLGPGLTSLQMPEGLSAREAMERKFGRPVDVVLFGDTHEEAVLFQDGVLFVNPGSPTFPGLRHQRGSLGTFALLEVRGRQVGVEIVQLEHVR